MRERGIRTGYERMSLTMVLKEEGLMSQALTTQLSRDALWESDSVLCIKERKLLLTSERGATEQTDVKAIILLW